MANQSFIGWVTEAQYNLSRSIGWTRTTYPAVSRLDLRIHLSKPLHSLATGHSNLALRHMGQQVFLAGWDNILHCPVTVARRARLAFWRDDLKIAPNTGPQTKWNNCIHPQAAGSEGEKLSATEFHSSRLIQPALARNTTVSSFKPPEFP